MGVCGIEREKKKREKKEKNINMRMKSTKTAIIKYESEIGLIERAIFEKKKQLEVTNLNPAKELDIKKDLVKMILKYQRKINYKNYLKKNLDIMEKKDEETKFVMEIDGNNKVLKDADDGNEKIINDNINNIHRQSKQIEIDDKLVDEEVNMNDGLQNKYEIDAFLNNFFNKK